ncbi:MAG: manganese efflux pump MntP family protein [Lachnospiraceae bacterium]|nr:manganese efflux pump MntP family protein [Lachnospiraceae bacterium]MDD7023403.1 manganese efflux pump MntP family protein [Oscillospiraceae bacterium]MDY5540348.1 manganese efflux pump MntP family protein [Lachnospiraceae bacterium]
MSLSELFILAVGLSMDAFAVSVCKGLSMQKMNWRHALVIGLYFGGFQAGMPLIGYLLGMGFQSRIEAVDHWIAFLLLGFIGINMIRESRDTDEEHVDPSIGFRTMVVLAVATSIDALAVGVTFAFLQVAILPAVCFIGVVTFFLSAVGVKIGNVFGTRYKSRAELTGGIILVLMGIKILAEHLGFLA